MKMHTRITEGGGGLSGGQRQRIAIARAILRDAPLLLLDDALSAVDTYTEEKILAQLRERCRVVDAAPRLLGATFTHGGVTLRLTEVEAYDGPDDPGSHDLRSGLNATEEITTARKDKVLAIPIQAVVVREVDGDDVVDADFVRAAAHFVMKSVPTTKIENIAMATQLVACFASWPRTAKSKATRQPWKISA